MTRREWLKLTTAAGGALALPNVTGLLASSQSGPAPATQGVVSAGRERLLADFGWRFHLGHANDPAQDFGYGRGNAFAKSGSLIPGGGRGVPSVSAAAFDDSQWTAVDLPHDWAIDLPFVSDRSVNGHGAKPLGRTYPDTSVGWYRRPFDIPATDFGRRIALEFDGVFRDAIVVLNGHYIGRNLSGYSPFRFDVTDLVNYGGKNALVVRVDATESEGWFYEGAGIYRHVWLEKTNPVHIGHWGTFVTSQVNAQVAVLTVQTEVVNDSDQEVNVELLSVIGPPSGAYAGSIPIVPARLAPWTRQTITQELRVTGPSLWSIGTPALYRLMSDVRTIRSVAPDGLLDRVETPFGIRTVGWDTDRGFLLNGTPVKIKGTCNHQDHAGVGAALPDRLQFFRIEKLKAMGCNAYRTSHNPPTAELLDACDRLGMLVLDETRMMSSSDEGLSQLERLVRRDRNHPSVFAWSIGNEEPAQGTELGAREAVTMKRLVKSLDSTRLVTEAMNNSWGRGLSGVVDVMGFNYRGGAPATDFAMAMDDYHRQHPAQPAMGTEVASTVSTRGIYQNDEARGYVSAYDRNFPPWASTAEEWWSIYNARPWLAGGFVWTGFDYRGEPTPYNWPCISSHFGIFDMCGFPKDLFYYYRAWWTDEPVLHLFPHWNWTGQEGQEIEVWCFTNCERVELFVNGTSAGAQDVKKDSHVAWKVPYAAGAIEARGVRRGQPLRARRETAGPAARILLTPDRVRIAADGEDLSVIVAQIVDAQGRMVPIANHEITFAVTGPGRVLGVGNGDPSSHEADRAMKRSAFNGLCMAIVQAAKTPGDIRVEAASPGLEGGSTVVVAASAALRAALL